MKSFYSKYFLLFLCIFLLCGCFFSACGEEAPSDNRIELEKLLAQNIPAEEYTMSSYADYLTALENARTVFNDPTADEGRLKAATESLRKAINALSRLADFSKLKELLAIEYPEVNYTAESYEAYREAREKATAVCNDPASKQSIINSAAEVLQYAINHLERKADVSSLGALVATPIPDIGYTSKSYQKYQLVLGEATELYQNRNQSMTKAQAAEYAQNVAICTTELENAIQGLVKRGSTLALSNTVQRISREKMQPSELTGELKPSLYYTEESYNALEVALRVADDAVGTGDYSQKELDQIEKDLLSAEEKLTVRAVTEDLENVILTADTNYLSTPELYSGDSYLLLNNAVNAGKELLNQPNISQQEVDQAIQNILVAIGSLEVIRVQADGNRNNHFGGLLLKLGNITCTASDYLENCAGFLVDAAALASGDVTVASAEGLLILEHHNGLRVELSGGSFLLRLRDGAALPSDTSFASVGEILLGLKQTAVSEILQNVPTESSDRNGMTIQTYTDGETGITLQLSFDMKTGRLMTVSCYKGSV